MKLFQKAFPENHLAQHPKKEEQDATTGSFLAFVFMKQSDSFSLLEEATLKIKIFLPYVKLTSLFMSKWKEALVDQRSIVLFEKRLDK